MDSTMTKVAAVRAARNVRQSQRAGLVDATSAALALEAHERHAITARLKERHEASEEITEEVIPTTKAVSICMLLVCAWIVSH